MSTSLCGIDCSKCEMNTGCKGCAETGGRPYPGGCIVAGCCLSKGNEHCGACAETSCKLRERIIAEFNALGIEDMPEVTCLYELKGSFVNLEYEFPGGQMSKMWDDDKVYLGNQLHKEGSNRCYGLTADENYLLVCEYGDGGADAEIVVFKKRGR